MEIIKKMYCMLYCNLFFMLMILNQMTFMALCDDIDWDYNNSKKF
jgi:hypothetical protein